MEDTVLLPRDSDVHWMRKALRLAAAAADCDEVPIGALVVRDGQVIAEAYNTRETDKCATHHAEILAIERACRALGGWRLPRCTLYVTLEPCPMCAGAVINSRIERVVFGAYDKKAGAYGSMTDLAALPFNHIPAVCGGVLEAECKELLSTYFKGKRTEEKARKRVAAEKGSPAK